MKVLDSNLRFVIPERILEMIMLWVEKAPGEISGMGTIVRDEDDPSIVRVTGVVLAGQVNTGVSTLIPPEQAGRAIYELRKFDGVARWYWHSHANMKVFWSGTDQDNMASAVGTEEDAWIIETVVNKDREIKTAYITGSPFVALDDVETTIESSYVLPKKDIAFCEREYKKKVAEFKLPPQPALQPSPAVVTRSWNDADAAVYNTVTQRWELPVLNRTTGKWELRFWSTWRDKEASGSTSGVANDRPSTGVYAGTRASATPTSNLVDAQGKLFDYSRDDGRERDDVEHEEGQLLRNNEDYDVPERVHWNGNTYVDETGMHYELVQADDDHSFWLVNGDKCFPLDEVEVVDDGDGPGPAGYSSVDPTT